MYQNLRLFFSLLWFVSIGALFASGLTLLVTWGGYAEYFFWSLGVWTIATLGTIATSLE